MELSAESRLRNIVFPFNKLRVIPYQEFSGAFNMAFDHYLCDWVGNTGIPVLRFYGWQPYCLSLGFHQKQDDVNIMALHDAGFDLVRRPTGGSAIFHSDELTYCLIIPSGSINHHQMYHVFHRFLANSLNILGFAVNLASTPKSNSYLNSGKDTFACFNRAAESEIQFEGKKLVGSAQKIRKNSILQHGSILFGNEHKKIIDFLSDSKDSYAEQKVYLDSNAISLSQIQKKIPRKIDLAEVLTLQFYINGTHEIFYLYPEINELRNTSGLMKTIYAINNVI